MSAWMDLGDGRWQRDTDERHLLLRVGGRYIEHHLSTIQVYDGPELADPENPLGDAVWVSTHGRNDLDGADLDGLWAAMRNDEYMQGAT